MALPEFYHRDYRDRAVPDGLVSFRAAVGETDLWIAASRDLTAEALRSIREHRGGIEAYIDQHPGFATSLTPWREKAPKGSLVARMVDAAAAVGVGPMASVAGVIAQAVAVDLAAKSSRVFVENGGDLYLIGGGRRCVGLWAGHSPLSGRVGLMVDPRKGLAICTSSGTVGPSLSFGRADAATVLSPSGALADAAATELGNRVRGVEDIERAVDWALSITGVTGALVIMGGVFGAKGDVELVPLKESQGSRV
ncbi:MAG: UPF0280 family protein [bacterium]|nr:MAG: UPF0280 family protein [bacterium]